MVNSSPGVTLELSNTRGEESNKSPVNTNLSLSCLKAEVTINPFALGLQEEKLKLRVPIKNWGGAHVISKDNTYSFETLLNKDGFSSFDSRNYITIEISVKSAEKVLMQIFQNLRYEGKTKGIIKIDVEGFESTIIKAIGKTLPEGMDIYIIFEHLDSRISPISFLDSFDENAKLYCLRKSPCVKGRKLLKLLALIINWRQTFRLVKWQNGVCATDFIIKIG